MKKQFLMLSLALSSTILVSQKNVNWNEHNLSQEGIAQYKNYLKKSVNTERTATCSDTSYYTVYKGSPQAEFPIVTDGFSFESIGQTYFNSSNLQLKGVRVWYSNPGSTDVDATIHVYDVDGNNQPSTRIAWADAPASPGAFQQGDFYFDEAVEVTGNFFVSVQALPNSGNDTLNIAYNNAGRGENLSHVGWHDGTSLGAWMSVLGDMSGDTDFMIFPIYDAEVTADLSIPSTALEGANFGFQVNSTIPHITDSMINFTYYMGAPQLYVDFYDANGDLEHQELQQTSGNYSYSTAGTYTVGHAAVWFGWSTLWLDPNDPNYFPYYCFDETSQDIEILPLATGVEEVESISYRTINGSVYFDENIELVNVFNVQGSLVSSERNTNNIVLSNEASGVYFIQVIDKGRNLMVKVSR